MWHKRKAEDTPEVDQQPLKKKFRTADSKAECSQGSKVTSETKERVASKTYKLKNTNNKGLNNKLIKDKPAATMAADSSVKSTTTDSKHSIHLPRKPEEVSSNWKQLLKSGKVVYNAKQSTVVGKTTSGKQSGQKKAETEKDEIWFDDVDEMLLETEGESKPNSSIMQNTTSRLVKPNSFEGVTKIVAMDCEMVGIGSDGKESMLARVSLVNYFGSCIYDKYVKPAERVTDYRTAVSGIRPSDVKDREDFKTVQKEVSDILDGRILVGHAIHNDLKVLFLDHPRKKIRDTSRYKPFRAVVKGGTPSLKKLSEALLGAKIQDGEHNSVQDAQAAMRIYTLHRKKWESSLKRNNKDKTTV